MKPCSVCKIEKPLDQFSPLKKARDGRHSQCRECLAAWRRKDRTENPDRYRRIEQKRYLTHGEKRRDRARLLWAKNTLKYNLVAKQRFAKKRTEYSDNRKRRFASDPVRRERRSIANKKWRQENSEYVSDRRKEKWRKATITERLRVYFGSSISHSLKRNGKGGKSWQQLVGYSAEQLKRHLERQFTAGMNWENYGEWHVDHILPASSFKYSSADEDDFKSCWALTNLRPLWSIDNIRKRDQRIYLI